MSVRSNFAVNLKRLCDNRGGNINQISREMGIGRQQIDRYLRMERYPRPAMMTKICEYFEISETKLLAEPGEDDYDIVPDAVGRALINERLANSLLKLSSGPPPSVEEGIYRTYFSVPGEPDVTVLALTFIRMEGGRSTFRRQTGMRETTETKWGYAKGDHFGLIVGRVNWLYFVAVNRGDPNEPSLLAVQWASTTRPLMKGFGMVIAPKGPIISTVIMERVKDENAIGNLLQECGTTPMGEVDRYIASLLREPLEF